MRGRPRTTRLILVFAIASVMAVAVVGVVARAGLQRNREELLGILTRVQTAIGSPSPGTLQARLRAALASWPDPRIEEFALVAPTPSGTFTVTLALRGNNGTTLVVTTEYPSPAPPPVPQALKGLRGVTTSPSFRGEAAIVAYAPGPQPGSAILASENAAAIYAPYFRSGMAAVALALVAVLMFAVDLAYSARAGRLRQQDSELRGANAALHALIEASPLAIFDLDTTGKVIGTWNPAAERMLGWTRDEVVGRRLPVVPLEHQRDFDGVLQRTFAGEVIADIQRTGLRKDGSPIRISIATSTVQNENGASRRAMAILSDISDRERHEAEVSFQAQLLASVSDAVFSTDLNDRITSWNAAAERLFGWTASEVNGKRFRDVLQPAPTDGEQEEVAYFRRDQAIVHVETETTAVLGPDGHILGFVNSARDLTRRRYAERSLAESQARFRRLVDNLPDIVYRIRLRPGLAVEYIGPSVQQLTGHSPERFVEDPGFLGSVVHPDDLAALQHHLTHPDAAGGRPVPLRWVHADGRIIWLEHRHFPVTDDAGRFIALEGVARDVTEARRTGEERARLAAVIEQSDEAVLMTEPNGTIVYVNPAFSRITGYARDEALGRNPRLLKSGEQGETFYRDLWHQLGKGHPFRGRIRNRRRDQSIYIADVVIAPVRDEDGITRHYVGLQRDVTEQVARDEALRQAQKMEAIGELTGGIAHDFNNLLTVILANAALLGAEAGESGPALAPYLRDIEDAATRGATMIRKLLGFSRKERLAPEILDLEQVVGELVRTLRRLIPTSIEVRTLTSGVPALALADRGAVEQMVLNLATNSRDAMPDGGVLTVTVGTCPPESGSESRSYVALQVSDTGIGMDEATQRRVFEPFFTTKPVGKGTGLGMAMVHGLMQQHGGRVSIESSPGRGTSIALCFPEAQAPAPTVVAADSAETPGGRERILLVEDEEGLRRVAQRALERLGYRVDSAEDGEAALLLLDQSPNGHRLVLSDMIMPRMSGLELRAEIRKRGSSIPFLLATGYSEAELPAEPDGAPIPLLAKPWSLKDLAAQVRSLLDQSGSGPPRS